MKICLSKKDLLPLTKIDYEERDYPPFIPLHPAGYRSGHVESMSSYLCRQAEMAMEWSHLYSQKLVERTVTDQNLPSCTKHSTDVIRTCNGIGIIASRFIEAVTKATSGEVNGKFLTLHPLKFLSDTTARGLQKQHLAWCPECWKEDTAAGKVPYVRLYWLVECTKICVVHDQKLSTYCPSCGEVKQQYPKFPRQWICDKCGENLSKPDENHVHDNFSSEDAWISHAIFALIDRVYSNEYELGSHLAAKAIRRLLSWSKLSEIEISERLNIDPKSIRNMMNPNRRPYFLALIGLCYRLDIPPDQFLLDKDILTFVEQWRCLPKPIYNSRITLTHKERSTILSELKKILAENPNPPVRVSHLGAKFGVTYTSLQYSFPEEYRELRKRRTAWEKEFRRRNHTARLENLADAVFGLVRAGVYPSQRKLRDLGLVLPSDLRREDAKQLLEVLQEIYADLQ